MSKSPAIISNDLESTKYCKDSNKWVANLLFGLYRDNKARSTELNEVFLTSITKMLSICLDFLVLNFVNHMQH